MKNNTEGATEQPINAPDSTAPIKQFGVDEIADLVSNKFLSDAGNADSKESETQSKNADPLPEAEDTQQDESSLTVEQEETAQAESNDDLTSEEDEEPEVEETERGLSKGVKKRIDKLTAKRKEAEAKVAELEAQMERLRQEAATPAKGSDAKNPYAHLQTPEQVQKELEQAKSVRRWCEMNPDGATVKDANGDETDYSSEDIRAIKVKALDAIEEHLPKQSQYIQNYQQMEQVANKEYPWWKDNSAREKFIAEKFLEAFPEIKRFPDYKIVIGDYIRGIQSRASASKKAGTAPARAPSQPRPTSAPMKSSSKNEAVAQAAKASFRKSGSSDDLASVIASKFLD